jgi:AraC-like DNA-binding protein
MTAPVTQAETLAAIPLAAGEGARFFGATRFPGLDCLTATFRTYVYAAHTHETYVVGTVDAGRETWKARGARHYAGPGDVLFNLPLDVHDGAPFGDGYSYRMTYPTVAFMQRVASGVSGRRVTATPTFKASVVRDPDGARLFADAHTALERGLDALAGEELLLRAYGRLLALHADIRPAMLGREPGAIARVREAIEQRYAESLMLSELAQIARLSTYHLIRAFRAEVGLTPHAYLVDVRVRRARDLLRMGLAPAEVALRVGFSDQAHLTRAFKARIGVAPGAYRRARRG